MLEFHIIQFINNERWGIQRLCTLHGMINKAVLDIFMHTNKWSQMLAVENYLPVAALSVELRLRGNTYMRVALLSY